MHDNNDLISVLKKATKPLSTVRPRAWYLIIVSILYMASYLILKQFITWPGLMSLCQLGYVVVLALPLVVKPIGRWIGLK
jgi:hypothetical protein